jgi:hypothetical protein
MLLRKDRATMREARVRKSFLLRSEECGKGGGDGEN